MQLFIHSCSCFFILGGGGWGWGKNWELLVRHLAEISELFLKLIFNIGIIAKTKVTKISK